MKSCLKLSPPSSPPSRDDPAYARCPPPASRPPYKRKAVSFCREGEEQVFIADDWDRTPAEVTQKLSYQDVLELKQLQLSLPRASQPPDPLARPHTQVEYLRRVPIGLMPLLPETTGSPVTTPPSEPSPVTPSSPQPRSPPTNTHWLQLTSPLTASRASPQHSPNPSPYSSPKQSPIPSRTSSPNPIPSNLPPRAPLRPRPHFAFLPLLPPSEEPSNKGPEVEPGEMTFNWNDEEEEVEKEQEETKAEDVDDIARTPHTESVLEGEMLERIYGGEDGEASASGSEDVQSADSPEEEVPSPSDGELTADESTPSLTTCSLSPTPSPSPSPPIISEEKGSGSAGSPNAVDTPPAVTSSSAYSYFQIPTNRPAADSLPYALKKMRLQGLPSPALTPPSPFDLYGPGFNPALDAGGVEVGEGRLGEVQAFERKAAGGRRGAGRRVASMLGLSVSGEEGSFSLDD